MMLLLKAKLCGFCILWGRVLVPRIMSHLAYPFVRWRPKSFYRLTYGIDAPFELQASWFTHLREGRGWLWNLIAIQLVLADLNLCNLHCNRITSTLVTEKTFTYLDIQHSKPMLERKVWPASKYIQKISGDFKMLRGDTVHSRFLLKSLAPYFPMSSWPWLREPRQTHSEATAPSLCRAPPWQDQVVWCLGSKQIFPPDQSLSGKAWHKVTSVELWTCVSCHTPIWNFLNIEGRNQIHFLSFCRPLLKQTRVTALGNNIELMIKLGVELRIYPSSILPVSFGQYERTSNIF